MTRAAGARNIIYGRTRARTTALPECGGGGGGGGGAERHDKLQLSTIDLSTVSAVRGGTAADSGCADEILRHFNLYSRYSAVARAPRSKREEAGEERTIGICCCLFVAQTEPPPELTVRGKSAINKCLLHTYVN